VRGFIKILAGLLGIVAVIAILARWNAISRATADVRRDDVAVWLHTPHVGPGSTLDAELQVYGGKEIGIRRVEVTGGAQPLEIAGHGEYWDGVITSEAGRTAFDAVELEIEVPPDARPGTDLELSFEVAYVRAVRLDVETFANEERTATVTVTVTVLSPGARVVAHLLSLGRSLLAFVLFTALYVWLGPKLLRRAEPGPGDGRAESNLDVFVFLLLAVIGIAGYVLFAQPLMAALATSSTVLVVLAMIAWLVGPPLLAVVVGLRLLGRQDRDDPDRAIVVEVVNRPTPRRRPRR
jgi:hypothetical protein